MRLEDTSAETIRLADYKVPDWLVVSTRLEFLLEPEATRVRSVLRFKLNPASDAKERPDLHLDGHSLKLISAAADDVTLGDGDYVVNDESMTVSGAKLPGDEFTWTCETEIDPKANTSLNGLYMSRDMYCTQCEAEGFRKITYYPDRPDVMSVFTVRVEGDLKACPILLSNGNPVDSGAAEGGRHFVEWFDPHPKPAYLFALVAGALVAHEDKFTTASGRNVDLAIFVRPGDEDKCAYAMDALIRSMRWDEEVYGLEYDLDLFMIVAVDDFNMGAMENKGLNIFNSKYILASPETATDRDYELIESIVAHEYFHNWTGNRITCRDWFQLCLKEGLTVFRDQQFSSDMRSEAVKRIDDVKMLRARQFREDAGPLAHPVRPEEYIEINNFYTATVYEKGAEVIRMLRLLVGPKGYRKALDLYFERHDGQACTIEDFIACFRDATGRSLVRFARWYSQAGTPHVTVETSYNAPARTYRMTFRQKTDPTPGQPRKEPLVIPIAFGLLEPSGEEITFTGEDGQASGTRVLELTEEEQSFTFSEVPEEPIPSLLRGLSAPVVLDRKTSDTERAFLLAHDPDPFNRWEAGRAYGVDVALRLAEQIAEGRKPVADPRFIDALGATLVDDRLDPAFRALAFEMPSEDELARSAFERNGVADPDAIHAALLELKTATAERLLDRMRTIYDQMKTDGPYSPAADHAGRRALRNRCLSYLVLLKSPELTDLAVTQFAEADNMSDALPALTSLVHVGASEGDAALASFYDRWKSDPLVIDKWLVVQATNPQEDTLERVIELTRHEAFNWKNPNKFRSLIGVFAMSNPSRFHAADGSGYRFFADWLIRLDPVNQQTTARLAGAFETWRRYDGDRQDLIRAELERIAEQDGLSKDSAEIVSRILAA